METTVGGSDATADSGAVGQLPAAGAECGPQAAGRPGGRWPVTLYFEVVLGGARGFASANRVAAYDLREVPPEAIFDFKFGSGARDGEGADTAYSPLESASDFRASAFGVEFLDSQGVVLAAVKTRQPWPSIDALEGHVPSVYGFWPRAEEFSSWRLVRGSEVVWESAVVGGPLEVEILEPVAGESVGAGSGDVEVVWRVCGDVGGGSVPVAVRVGPPLGSPAYIDFGPDPRLRGREVREGAVIATVEHSADGGATYELLIDEDLSERSVWSVHHSAVFGPKASEHRVWAPRPAWFVWSEGSDQARVRVLVSSGARWAVAESEVFAVDPAEEAASPLTVSPVVEPAPVAASPLAVSPVVRLLSPVGGASVEHGEGIVLEARLSGFDAFDGDGAALVTWWGSVLSGVDDGRRHRIEPVPGKSPARGGVDGVHVWRLDTDQLRAGVNEVSLTAVLGGRSANDSVRVVVVAPGGAPTAVDDSARWQPDVFDYVEGRSHLRPSVAVPLVIDVLANDLDSVSGLDPDSVRVVEQPGFGRVRIEQGSVVYTARQDDGRHDVIDTFSYQLCTPGPRPACSTAQVTVRLEGTSAGQLDLARDLAPIETALLAAMEAQRAAELQESQTSGP